MNQQEDEDRIKRLKWKERNYAIAMVIIIWVVSLIGLWAATEYNSFLPTIMIIGAAVLFVIAPLVNEWDKCSKERVRIEAGLRLQKCPSCGTKVLPGNKYCTRCGRNIE